MDAKALPKPMNANAKYLGPKKYPSANILQNMNIYL